MIDVDEVIELPTARRPRPRREAPTYTLEPAARLCAREGCRRITLRNLCAEHDDERKPRCA